MGSKDFYRSGDYNVRCDTCGAKFKASELRLQWNGIRACYYDFEYRNAQELLRPPRPEQPPWWTRPTPPTIWVPGANIQDTRLVDQTLIDQTTIG